MGEGTLREGGPCLVGAPCEWVASAAVAEGSCGYTPAAGRLGTEGASLVGGRMWVEAALAGVDWGVGRHAGGRA